ncbi:class I SAM-dependent methyltransferase [Chitinophaga oryzae]|uniref:Class I SAM-dependent methyltransferase n=1 Tax=Chitinophaga oryzae TaxID=2725414 RepID=A0AAE6ZEY1_9BACT|nr:class I SAM-dependent methyltransferase [Chitinophaga oryzae]QJB31431.1 class I SAM-dependent methyltransferase [Chitinophaga oryzae]QJB37915.1 class I SAM-dependent methyltransferase [Chitinophaga oryzae]
MELQEAIQLIKADYIAGTWADLGCGSGLFTYALANLLPAGSTIYAVDAAPVQLTARPNPAQQNILPLQLDFVQNELPVEGLQGILMANSLHYVKDKPALVRQLSRRLAPGAQWVLVEYDTDAANTWVPYPIRRDALQQLLAAEGFSQVTFLGERPSVYRSGRMYALRAMERKRKA